MKKGGGEGSRHEEKEQGKALINGIRKEKEDKGRERRDC